MKRRLMSIGAAVLAVLASTLFFTRPALAATGLHVSGTSIVEANGTKFVMRGINHEHTWFTSQTGSFADRLGSIERVKCPGYDLRCHAGAGVADT